MTARLDELVARRGSMRAIAVMRAAFGLIVIRHLWRDATADVVPVERFHVPWWSWLPEPSPLLYRSLVWIGVLAGLAMLVGLACRVATATALAVVSYLLVLDMTAFAHNRAFLVWMLAGLAVLPTDRTFSLDATLARQRSARGAPPDDCGPVWPVFGLRVVVSSVYFTSGFTKLLDDDWRSGLVLWDRVNRFRHNIPFDGWIEDVLTDRAFFRVLSPGAIAIELFLAVGLWSKRTRVAAIWVALVFHASIEVTASVQTFSYSAIAALLLWVTPSTRDRRVCGGSAAWRAWVRRLDILQRFEVVSGDQQVVLHDRDRRVRRDRDARLVVLSRLPLCFPVAAVVLGWHRRPGGRGRPRGRGTVQDQAPRRARTRAR